jgi:hypothetical protein
MNRAHAVPIGLKRFAHHWVVMGDLLPGRPWMDLPHAARLYCRRQLSADETFQTKTAWAVQRLRRSGEVE